MRAGALVLVALLTTSCAGGDPSPSALETVDATQAFVAAELPEQVYALASGSAARTELGTDTWTALPDPPFEELEQVQGVWTGRELVVVGMSCSERDEDSATVTCEPGGVVGAAFDGDEWRRLHPPDGALFREQRRAVGIRPSGWDGDEAVFLVQSDLVAIDPSDDRWRVLPSLPAGVIPELFCTSPLGTVVASSSERGDLATTTSAASVLEGDRWSEPVALDGPIPLYADHACVDGRPVVIASTVREGGHRLDIGTTSMFDVEARSWRDLPAPELPLGDARVIGGDERGRLMVVVRGRVHLLDIRSGRWAGTPAQIQDDDQVQAITATALAVSRGSAAAGFRWIELP